MSLIRIRALEVFRDKIECAVPALVGKVCAGQNKHPHMVDYPHCSVMLMRGQYLPDQACLHSSPSPSTAVYRVGRIEATAQIRLGSANCDERYILGDAILNEVFMQDCLRPGICTFNVPDCYDALVAWELENWSWDDEFAFNNKWYSVLTCTAQIPVLVRKGGVYSIDEICLQFTEDLQTEVSLLTGFETTTIDATT